MHILSRAFTDKATRVIVAPFVTLLVLVPVIVCNAIDNMNVRLGVIILAANIFVVLLSLFTRCKIIELAMAGATYV